MNMQQMRQDRIWILASLGQNLQTWNWLLPFDFFSLTHYSISHEAEGTLDKNPSERDLINQMCSYNQGAAKAITKTKDQGQDFLWDNRAICI